MGLQEGDEDEVATTASTTSAISEQANLQNMGDSSATATPSVAGTPSDSLDRNTDPGKMMATPSGAVETEKPEGLTNVDNVPELANDTSNADLHPRSENQNKSSSGDAKQAISDTMDSHSESAGKDQTCIYNSQCRKIML